MATPGNLVTALNDPLLHEIELPLRAEYHPVGFPMKLASNSRHVIAAADSAWGCYEPQFSRPPLSIHVVVQPDGPLTESPVFRSQGELLTIVSDRHNFGAYDANSLFGYCFVSEATAAHHLRLRMHFLEAMTYSLLAQTYAMPMHAAAVIRGDSGFLLCGQSGAGKSTLSYACARAGWTFVSDDATWLPVDCESRTVIGAPRHARFREDAPRLFPELARYPAAERPNGKPTVEAAMADLPGICTAATARVDHFIFLDRTAGARGRITPVATEEALERIVAESASYGERVRQMYERTVAGLRGVAAWRLEYETLEQALRLLSEVA